MYNFFSLFASFFCFLFFVGVKLLSELDGHFIHNIFSTILYSDFHKLVHLQKVLKERNQICPNVDKILDYEYFTKVKHDAVVLGGKILKLLYLTSSWQPVASLVIFSSLTCWIQDNDRSFFFSKVFSFKVKYMFSLFIKQTQSVKCLAEFSGFFFCMTLLKLENFERGSKLLSSVFKKHVFHS